MTTTVSTSGLTTSKSKSKAKSNKRRFKFGPGSALRWVVLLGVAVFCLVPLLWLLLAPFKNNVAIRDTPLALGTFDGFIRAWNNLSTYNDGAMYHWMFNSVIYSLVPLVISIVISLTAAYALATMRFAGRKVILLATLLAIVLPGAALVLPLFLEINAFGLVNTAWSVILPASFYPFGVYLAFVYFSTSIPQELLEAARIDGCGEVGVFLRVALPLAKPVIALLAFFSFVANWNNYFLPYVMLTQDDKYNLPVGLGVLLASSPALHPGPANALVPLGFPEAALAGLIVVLPIALMFIFFQRFLVRGILSGSTKG